MPKDRKLSRKGTTRRKAKRKVKAKAKPKVHGHRVAIYFGKNDETLLKWAREHAAKRGVGLNRLVMDGLRNVHELETGDVHYDAAKARAPGVDH